MLTPRPSMVRGWCPTLDHPMQSGDGLLVRVKPPLARLTPGAAHALADAATRYGNGVIELTQRGNLQLRGLRPETVAPFAQAMRDAGLAGSPEQESRRKVLPPPLLDADPTLAPNAARLTAQLKQAFATDPRLAHLPAKFAIAIDAGGILGARPVAADLIVRTDGHTTELRPAHRGLAPAPVGLLRYPGTPDAAFGLAPPFGQLDSAQLHHLATLAARYATTLRITPWRVILLARIPQAEAPLIAATPYFIADPADPRLLVTACIGAPGCARATVATRHAASRLRPTRPIHVSGCSKGCAHPAPAPFTLVGNNGRYDLVQDGRAGDPPMATNLTIDDATAILSSPDLFQRPPGQNPPTPAQPDLA